MGWTSGFLKVTETSRADVPDTRYRFKICISKEVRGGGEKNKKTHNPTGAQTQGLSHSVRPLCQLVVDLWQIHLRISDVDPRLRMTNNRELTIGK